MGGVIDVLRPYFPNEVVDDLYWSTVLDVAEWVWEPGTFEVAAGDWPESEMDLARMYYDFAHRERRIYIKARNAAPSFNPTSSLVWRVLEMADETTAIVLERASAGLDRMVGFARGRPRKVRLHLVD